MASQYPPAGIAGSKIQELFPDVIVSKITPAPEHPFYNYDGFKPGQEVLASGHTKSFGRRAFGVETIYQRDQAVRVRDGTILYTDIFRPATSDKKPIPCILPWSPYGKTGTGPQNYDLMAPHRAGIPLDRTSGYEKFEAPDPAEWAERGYAVINIDARGAGHSEGVIAHWGNQEAEDIYDVIQWLSIQEWCNGSVVMAGNSWLAISQINFASRLQHPALKAIAPWESYTDLYRHFVGRGGRPHIPSFHRMIANGFAGPVGVENVFEMFQNRPMYDDYWEAKRIPVEKIDNVPMYVVASYSSMLHTYGSFQTFQTAKTTRKWLRVHPYQEWFDIYRSSVSDDLQTFFDAYAKGDVDALHKWESQTPPVKLSLLGFEASGSPSQTVIERSESDYPLKRQRLKTLYLDTQRLTLETESRPQEFFRTYEGRSLEDGLSLTTRFERYTELAGYPKAILYMSCKDHDDMDIVVQIRKIDASGKQLAHLNYPCPVPIDQVPDVNTAKTLGPQGFLRASHHVSRTPPDLSASSEAMFKETDIHYGHHTRQSIDRGTIVCLEIPIWPIGMVFEAGEGLALNISGHDMALPETEMCRLTQPEDENVGLHSLHTGPEHQSQLIIPVIEG